MIRIRELSRLQNLKNLRTAAGKEGLDRTVTAAVLFEYDPSRMQLPDFYKGDLVVTTLAYAIGDAELVARSLITLIKQGIAGLLVKTAYFDKLPQEVLDLADERHTPVLLFDETYIEEVILQVTDLIRGRQRFSGYEKELDSLILGRPAAEKIREAADRICPAGSGEICACAILPDSRIENLDELIWNEIGGQDDTVCMAWKDMRVLLRSCGNGKAGEKEAALAEHLLAEAEGLHIGIGSLQEEREKLDQVLREAVYAAKTARLRKVPQLSGGDLGIYAYLFPLSEDPFSCAACRKSMAVIRNYDAHNHTSLETTAGVYVHEHMDIRAAAKTLFQHPNTVRYRLTKVQQLLGIRDDDMFPVILEQIVLLTEILEDKKA